MTDTCVMPLRASLSSQACSTYANLCAMLREAISVVIVLIVCKIKLNFCELLSGVLVYGISVQLLGGAKVCRQ